MVVLCVQAWFKLPALLSLGPPVRCVALIHMLSSLPAARLGSMILLSVLWTK